MHSPFRINRKVKLVLSKLGSLILLLQKTPVVQMILPEARVVGAAGVGEIAKWSVAAVAGLGVFDSVAGATTLTQLVPSFGSTTCPATSGNSLSFTVQLTGTPYTKDISYWKTTGTLPAGLAGAKSPTDATIFTISGVPSQTGSFPIKIYAVGFSGDSYSKSYTISVSPGVVTPPVITTDPSSVTIASGTTTTLTVSTSGSAPTFQWYLGSSGDTSHPVTGATSSSYTTPSLFNTYTYWVRATNSAGTADSNAATVTVMVPAAISSHPLSVGILSGNTASLSVGATGDSLSYQWYLGNSGVTTDPVPGANSASFITPVLTSTASYWVRVSNQLGGVNSNTAIVTVLVAPTITKQPSSLNTLSGRAIALSVTAGGSSPTFQWYVGSSGDTTNPIPGATSSSYTTPPLSVTTSYWVRASNGAGNADSVTATVTVVYPISITQQPVAKSIKSGTSTSLKVAITGSSPKFQWYIGSPGITTNPVAGATSATLKTGVLTATTTYWVKITNLLGSVNSKAATVTVIKPPAITTQPLSVSIKKGTSTTLKVVATGTSLTYQWYVGSSGTTTKPVSGATSASFKTPALSATTKYWVKIKNSVGSVNSKAATVTVTAATIQAGAPTDLASGGISGWLNNRLAKTASFAPAVSGSGTSADSLACNPCVLGNWPLVSSTGNVSFVAVSAATGGCTGVLHYELQTAAVADSGEWKAVAGFSDIVGDDQSRTYLVPAASASNAFRLKVSLAR